MKTRRLVEAIGPLGILVLLVQPAFAQVSPVTSTVAIAIAQYPLRAACMAAVPPVARLCPDIGAAPVFDTVTFDVTALDAAGVPEVGVLVTAVETGGTVNITAGGATAAFTDAMGDAVIMVSNASGYGTIQACAGGVILPAAVEVRSPDVAKTGLPAGCTLGGIALSFVTAADLTNPVCGFFPKFGLVVPGVNSMWDLDCNGAVSASDVIGILGKGGVIQHFGHGDVLAAKSTCP